MKKIIIVLFLLITPYIVFSQEEVKTYTILLAGESFAEPANGWFEDACIKLNATPLNRAIGGLAVGHTANRIAEGSLYTTDELEQIDAFAIMHCHDFDVYDRSQIKVNYTDYVTPFNPWINFAASFDYIIKRYTSDCYNLKFNPKSKYYNTPNGKPAVMVLCTDWHDSRELYNPSIRRLAESWGFPIVEFDKNIGFSKHQLHPVTKLQYSCIYAFNNYPPDSIYGWHPIRGKGEYIQKRMGAIFSDMLAKVLPYKFNAPNARVLTKPINIDFGTTLTIDPGWNNLSDYTKGSISNLFDTDGVSTGISIVVDDAFSGESSSGPLTTNATLNLPSTVTQDMFFGYTSEPTGGFMISKLNAAQKYKLTLFSSRKDVTDNREISFNVKGLNEKTVLVNASNNVDNVAIANDISPTTEGTIKIALKAGPSNNNASKFFYINSLQIASGELTDINEKTVLSNVRMFPNPVAEIVEIVCNEPIKDISIIDVYGKPIKHFNAINTERTQLNVGFLSKGIYLVKVENKMNKISYLRLIKK